MSPRENQYVDRGETEFDIGVRGVTISHVTLSCSQILYYTFYSMFAADIMILSKELCYYLNLLEVIEQMIWSTHSEIQIVVLQILVARILQNSAFLSNLMYLLD